MENLNFIQYSRALVNENKWRASRYGLDGHLIDFGKEEEVNTRAYIRTPGFCRRCSRPTGIKAPSLKCAKIIERGTGMTAS